MFLGHFKYYFDVTKWLLSKCVSCLLIFKISLPINTIILFIQTDSQTLTNTIGNIYLMNQSQLIITSHIQSYRNRGIASSLMTFPHSFSITPTKLTAHFRGSVKNSMGSGEAREMQTHAGTLPAGVAVGHCQKCWFIHFLMLYLVRFALFYFCTTNIFLIQFFEEALAPFPPQRKCPFYVCSAAN